MGLDVGLFSLCGCKGFGDLIVGSGLEVSGWLRNLVYIYIFFFLSGSGLTCDDASNGLVFALIPKLTQHNQNKIERTKKIKGYDLGVST